VNRSTQNESHILVGLSHIVLRTLKVSLWQNISFWLKFVLFEFRSDRPKARTSRVYTAYEMSFFAADNPGQREHVHDRTARNWSAFNRSPNPLRSVQRSSETHLHESGTVRLYLDRWKSKLRLALSWDRHKPQYSINRCDINASRTSSINFETSHSSVKQHWTPVKPCDDIAVTVRTFLQHFVVCTCTKLSVRQG